MIYVDESGKPPYTDPENYVLSAVIIQEQSWETINNAVINLKESLFPNQDSTTIELHTLDILRARRSFHGLPLTIRHGIMQEIAQLINDSSCTLISVIVEKHRVFPSLQTSEWVELWAWRLLCERLEKFLENHNPSHQTVDYGLICMDSENPQADESIRLRIRRFRRQGSMFVECKYLIEDPFFVSSENVNLVQLADFVAWASRRKYRRSSASRYESVYRSWFSTIYSRFDQKSGVVRGYGIKRHP